jgi:hypothetical protein
MSRSRRKTPCGGNTTSDSEKQDKQIASRQLRRRNRQLSRKATDEVFQYQQNELYDNWKFAKDGKSRWLYEEHPELMRK